MDLLHLWNCVHQRWGSTEALQNPYVMTNFIPTGRVTARDWDDDCFCNHNALRPAVFTSNPSPICNLQSSNNRCYSNSPSAMHPVTMERTRRHLAAPINLKHAYLPLLICCFISGLIDASAFNALTLCMSMQTGLYPLWFHPVHSTGH